MVTFATIDTSTHRGFYGGMLSTEITTRNFGTHRPYAYVLFQQDYNNDDTLTVAPTTTVVATARSARPSRR